MGFQFLYLNIGYFAVISHQTPDNLTV